jgi:excisionase family DNA binding protein
METSTTRTLVRAPAVARLLDLPTFTIYALVRSNRIPHVRVGRVVRFDPAAIEQWIAAGGTKPNNNTEECTPERGRPA